MEQTDISGCFDPRARYRVTYFALQYWNAETYSYRDVPRPDHGILLITQGKIEFLSPISRVLAQPGDMIYLPKGSRYEAIIRPEYGETKDYLINFDTDSLSCPEAPLRLFHTENRGYLDLFAEALEKRIKNQLGEFGMLAVFFELLEAISRESRSGALDSGDRQMEKARALLSDPGNPSVARIARSLGISESGLRRAFKNTFGVSPVQYRIHIRINQAKYLLESTEMTVSAVADALGFYDQAYFCKIFRKYIGVSPKQYALNKKI